MAGELYIGLDLSQVNRANGHAPEEWLIASGPSLIEVRNLVFPFLLTVWRRKLPEPAHALVKMTKLSSVVHSPLMCFR